MSFVDEFLDMMPHEVTVEPWSGSFNDEGAPLYGTAATYKCMIEEKVKLVRDMQGNERASNTTLYVAGGPFTAHDRITMPASFSGLSKPPIINVANLADEKEHSHTEVFL